MKEESGTNGEIIFIKPEWKDGKVVNLISWTNTGRSFKVKTKIKESCTMEAKQTVLVLGENNTWLGYQQKPTTIAAIPGDYRDLLNCEGSRTTLSPQMGFGWLSVASKSWADCPRILSETVEPTVNPGSFGPGSALGWQDCGWRGFALLGAPQGGEMTLR